MKNINLFIKENVDSIGNYVYIVDHADEKRRPPDKKLNNAIKAFNCEESYRTILAIQDGTVFGSSKEGFVFTGEKMIHHEHGEFKYNDIKSVEYVENKMIDEKSKEKIEKYVLISKDDKVYKFQHLYGIDYKKFAEFLNQIISEFDEYVEEDQLKTIAEMPEELKVAYIKILVNMTFSDDEQIDSQELSEILALMTKLELNADTRFKIRNYITEISKDNIEQVETLIEVIKDNSESTHHKLLMISLVKDIINTHFGTKNAELQDFEFLNNHQKLFNVSDDEIALAFSAIKYDYKILNADLDDEAIIKNLKTLASNAASVGVPLGAVYLSGSIGMSAAGITSGLASLGMGGVLGFSGMVTGIGVAVLLGVGVYKGVQHLTGANNLTKYATRSLMLQGALKQTQKTISFVIDDINYLVKELNNTILNYENSTEKMKKLENMISQFASALKQVDNRSNQFQNSSNRLKCPKKLDEPRLKVLTSEHMKKPFYDYIINNYEENTFMLKENVQTEVLEKMNEIFTVIGYFEVASTIKGKASEGLDKLKGFMN